MKNPTCKKHSWEGRSLVDACPLCSVHQFMELSKAEQKAILEDERGVMGLPRKDHLLGPFNKEDFKPFNWDDLNEKVLWIHVSKNEAGDFIVAGSTKDGTVYVLHEEIKSTN